MFSPNPNQLEDKESEIIQELKEVISAYIPPNLLQGEQGEKNLKRLFAEEKNAASLIAGFKALHGNLLKSKQGQQYLDLLLDHPQHAQPIARGLWRLELAHLLTDKDRDENIKLLLTRPLLAEKLAEAKTSMTHLTGQSKQQEQKNWELLLANLGEVSSQVGNGLYYLERAKLLDGIQGHENFKRLFNHPQYTHDISSAVHTGVPKEFDQKVIQKFYDRLSDNAKYSKALGAGLYELRSRLGGKLFTNENIEILFAQPQYAENLGNGLTELTAAGLLTDDAQGQENRKRLINHAQYAGSIASIIAELKRQNVLTDDNKQQYYQRLFEKLNDLENIAVGLNELHHHRSDQHIQENFQFLFDHPEHAKKLGIAIYELRHSVLLSNDFRTDTLQMLLDHAQNADKLGKGLHFLSEHRLLANPEKGPENMHLIIANIENGDKISAIGELFEFSQFFHGEQGQINFEKLIAQIQYADVLIKALEEARFLMENALHADVLSKALNVLSNCREFLAAETRQDTFNFLHQHPQYADKLAVGIDRLYPRLITLEDLKEEKSSDSQGRRNLQRLIEVEQFAEFIGPIMSCLWGEEVQNNFDLLIKHAEASERIYNIMFGPQKKRDKYGENYGEIFKNIMAEIQKEDHDYSKNTAQVLSQRNRGDAPYISHPLVTKIATMFMPHRREKKRAEKVKNLLGDIDSKKPKLPGGGK